MAIVSLEIETFPPAKIKGIFSAVFEQMGKIVLGIIKTGQKHIGRGFDL